MAWNCNGSKSYAAPPDVKLSLGENGAAVLLGTAGRLKVMTGQNAVPRGALPAGATSFWLAEGAGL